MKKKLIFIVLDGVGDKRVNKHPTPLDNPRLYALHSLAKKSATGIVHTVPGIAPESDTAIFSLLGYSLKKYPGRGPLEAIGSDIPFKNGNLALRCNFATSSGTEIIDRRVSRSLTSEEARRLEKTINSKVKLYQADFIFRATIGHRGVVVFKAKKNLSSAITNTDPAYQITKSGLPEALKTYKSVLRHAKPMKKEARLSADIVNDFTSQAYLALSNDKVNQLRIKKGLHPADLILSRDAGNFIPRIPSLSKQFKRKWAIIADMPLERGIAKVSGMSIIDIPMGKNDPKSYSLRVKTTLKALRKYDCIYIHLKGPDIYGHDGDFEGKKKSVQDINDYFFAPLLKRVSLKDFIICVTADHSTPCSVKGHSKDPVPIMVYGAFKKDKVQRFSEAECRRGSLGVMKGIDVMKLLKRVYAR